ncbi:synaptosomal-associated protein 29-like [Macrosteles quadrilineatus]|uniref:synaptosomal-associated protein 29-like n=1 Tax=Macrosteles quadrilineatus TaxID=74068 RepID=UPI0023E1A0BD|nr:synaptosomal-associated protein 29-like [Macrosteles quadrilineatus]XP_054280782.1 synaptosomal-associated protein 29-like [Macrosteles quadrilineatus]
MSNYLSNNKSALFSVEDEVDDDEFLRHPQSGRSGYMMGDVQNSQTSNIDQLHQQRLEKQKEIQARIVETSQRSLSTLLATEEIGVSTAEELLRQREQLQRTEKHLDDINSTLRFSQKHIQGIKSVFGGLKNYLSGKNSNAPQGSRSIPDSPVSNSDSKLVEAVESSKPYASSSSQNHPALRVRGLTDESSERFSAADPEKALNENLNHMVDSISRLKGLAHGLGEEIESQNELVENIIDKTEKADITLRRQNKDIGRILKK